MSARRVLTFILLVLMAVAVVVVSAKSTGVPVARGEAPPEPGVASAAEPARTVPAIAGRVAIEAEVEVTFMSGGRPVPGVHVHQLPHGARAVAPQAASLAGVAGADGRVRLGPEAFAGELVALAPGFVAAAVPRGVKVVELDPTPALVVHVEDEAGACPGVRIAFTSKAAGPLPDVLPRLAPGEIAIPAGVPGAVFAATSGRTSPIEFLHAPAGRHHLEVAAERPYQLTGIEGWPPGLVHDRSGQGPRPTELWIEVGTWHAAILQAIDDRILSIRVRRDAAADLNESRLHHASSAVETSLRRQHPGCLVLVRARSDAVPFESELDVLGERAGAVTRRVGFAPLDVAAARPLVLGAATKEPPVTLTVDAVDEDGATIEGVPLVARITRPNGGSFDLELEAGVPRSLPRVTIRLSSHERWVASQVEKAPAIDLVSAGATLRHRLVLRRTHRLVRGTVQLAEGSGRIRATIRQHQRDDAGRIRSTMQTHRYAASGEAFEVWLAPGEFDWVLTADGHEPLEETVPVEAGAEALVLDRTLSRR